MEWSELDLGKRLWNIPRQRAKNDRAHAVHLSAPALEIIESLPQIEVPRDADDKPRTTSQFVFTTTGFTPVSGMSHAKAAVDRRMLDAARKEMVRQGRDPEAAAIDDWILHDLRRTAATGMAGLSSPRMWWIRSSTMSLEQSAALRRSITGTRI